MIMLRNFLVLLALALGCLAHDDGLVIKIGAIFFDSEMQLVKAFDATIEELNALSEDLQLNPIKHFLTLADSILLQDLTCDLIGNGVAAILGPSSKAGSDIVEVLCNMTGIPHLQFDWNMQYSTRERLNHQLTVNVAPSEQILSTALSDILSSKVFNWKSFTIAYERHSNLFRLQQVLAMRELHKSAIKLQEFERGDDYRILWKRISNSREKFVLLDCPYDIITDVVNASIPYNMTGSFNKLFLTNLDTHNSGIERFYSKDFRVAVSAIRIRTYGPMPVHDEVDVFGEVIENQFPTLSSQLVYDAVLLFYNSIKLLSKRSGFYAPQFSCGRGFWQPGPHLVQQMKDLTPKQVSPPYKTQRLQLNSDGQREEFNLDVYNPIIEWVSHIWNKNVKLVPFDKVNENTTQTVKKQLPSKKDDFAEKKVNYKVATRLGKPYFSWREAPIGVHYQGNERFEGFTVDLLYNLSHECKFDFQIEPVGDNKYGSYDPVTKQWNGIIREVMDNNAQIGICDLTITQERRSVVDFTVPFMQLGISILGYEKPPPKTNIYKFLNPYNMEVWLYVMVSMLITAMALILVGRMDPSEWEKPVMNDNNEEEQENPWHLHNTMWLVLGSILNQGCDILPRGIPMRLLTAMWWIFALLVSQTYIAKLAAFITSGKMVEDIASLHDLVDQNKVKFGTVRGGATSLYFSESNETDNRLAWNKMISAKPDAFTKDNEEGVDRVRVSKGDYAFLMETTNLYYSTQRNCELKQIGASFGEKHYGIAVPLNSQFRSNLSVGILRLSEKGIIYNIRKHWFDSEEFKKCPNKTHSMMDDQFGMDSLAGLFVILIVGVVVAFVIAAVEFFWHVHKIVLKHRIKPMEAFKGEIFFMIRVWLSRKPLRTYRQSRDSTSTGYSSLGAMTNSSNTKKRKKSKRRSD